MARAPRATRTPRAPTGRGLYGIMAEFEDPNALVAACKAVKQAGYRRFDAFTPFPMHEVIEYTSGHRTEIPLIAGLAALAGVTGGFTLQAWLNGLLYPLIISGRPPIAWQSFVPVTFESGILITGISIFLGLILLNGFPQPYHPAFNAPNFDRASQDRFFLVVEARDPKFEAAQVRRLLEGTHPASITEVEN